MAMAALSSQFGSLPQWLKSFRLMQPTAPSFLQKSYFDSEETTAMGRAPWDAAS